MKAFSLVLLAVSTLGANIKHNGRIIGGHDAAEHAHPHQVYMFDPTGFFCGGSIIDESTILTAGHCIKQDMRVFAGTNVLFEGGVERLARWALAHENFNPHTMENDIGILKLNTNLVFNDQINSIELDYYYVGAGFNAVVTEWGRLSGNGATPINLQEIMLTTITTKQCQDGLPRFIIDDRQICTGPRTGEGACYGDSGGPLTVYNRQVGIASWVIPCGIGYPDVFTRVSSYMDWIEANRH